MSFIYEDEFIFALNKPALIHSVSLAHGGGGPSLAALLLDAYPTLQKVSDRPEDAGLVHRLDFETSGVIIGAKSPSIWKALHRELSSANSTKSYLAILQGNLTSETLIECWLGSPYRRAGKVRVYQRKPSGKVRAQPAKSLFTPVHWNKKNNSTTVKVALFGGRRHQIRAHAAAIGHPLYGDVLYGAEEALLFSQQKNDSYPPFFLHAEALSFRHPQSGQSIRIEAPCPAYAREMVGSASNDESDPH